MPFKVFKVKKEIEGKIATIYICRDGVNGTGVSLPFTCGFCRDRDGKPTVAFRSQRQRTKHANDCLK